MALSLRTQTAGGASGWHLGETRAIASKDETIDLGDGAQAICRDIARTIPASSYSAYYNLAASAASSTMFANRQATGLTGVNQLGSNGLGTLIATGPGGGISRSTNGGQSFTKVTAPAAAASADLGPIAYGSGLWIIPYGVGKVLRSQDDGATWIDTSIAGGLEFESAGKLHYFNGAFIYARPGSSGKIYRSTDGTSWADISANAQASPGSTLTAFTVGQGLHVLLYGNTPRFSGDGGITWQSGTDRGLTQPEGGLYYLDGYWINGGVAPKATGPKDGPPPVASGYVFASSATLVSSVKKYWYYNTSYGTYPQNLITFGCSMVVDGVDGVGVAMKKDMSYGTPPTVFFTKEELPEIIDKGLYYQKTGMTITGGPAGAIGTTTEGILYRCVNNSSAVGIKATSGEVEIMLSAYTDSKKPTDSHWYTRIR